MYIIQLQKYFNSNCKRINYKAKVKIGFFFPLRLLVKNKGQQITF